MSTNSRSGRYIDFITQRVEQVPSGELPPGVLHVRKDGKRTYNEAFKAELVLQCQVHGTSVAATAMAHGINANIVRRWMVPQGARSASPALPPALLPITVRTPPAVASPPPLLQELTLPECIEIKFYGARVRLHGPVDAQRLGVVLNVLAQRS